jgi:tripartite-type tricarboxylate transporter receptor subunit TctC
MHHKEEGTTMKTILAKFFPALACGLLGAALWAPTGAEAEDYPTRTVTIIVPFSPGGPGDLTARFIAGELQKSMGQPFVVENRPGANGVIAAGAAAQDGYTLLQISSSHTVNESLIKNKAYELLRDFEPVASLNYTELVMVVRNDLGVSSVKEFIALAKSKPGVLNYASSGPGSSYHMAGELFKTMTGVSMVHVPYKRAATARTDLVGGHIDVMFDALPAEIELIRSGRAKALATTAKTRSTVLPDVPTVDETVAGFENTIFIGLMAPKKTPVAIVDKLHDAINKILSKPESQAFWKKQGAQPLVMTREEFTKYLKDDIVKQANLVKISGAKVN